MFFLLKEKRNHCDVANNCVSHDLLRESIASSVKTARSARKNGVFYVSHFCKENTAL